jgi:hypothetical protein
MPPDVTAGIFWLKNRDPENWRDVQNIDHVLGKTPRKTVLSLNFSTRGPASNRNRPYR